MLSSVELQLLFFVNSTWFPFYQVWQSDVAACIFCHSHCEEKPQTFYVNIVDSVVSLVEVVRSRFVPAVFNVSKMFF